ncbi:AraC family transcriptional regulator [Niveibacterium sp. 24ML]|uniref:AraC family transcriptional regulator n=1 Tax=Niveibacterium sp. 24ML TaxID=2985512 RepID=UPI00226EEDB3|nr:AraC family transcriptional regulator [Niveibacterium sp. 24ML]MCX9155578.1 AraC family transcriptional regulator [Niveibacterium sp. 24ML]
MTPAPRLPALVPTGFARVGILSRAPELLIELGCSPQPILDAVGVSEAFLACPDNLINFQTAGSLLARCALATGDDFGVRLGARANTTTLGLLGSLLLTAPNVGEALRLLIQHLHMHSQTAVAALDEMSDTVSLSYGIHHLPETGSEQVYGGGMGIALGIMRSLCGAQWRPAAVHFPFRAPASLGTFRQIFGCSLLFDADLCAMSFPVALLAQPIQKSAFNVAKHFHLLRTIAEFQRHHPEAVTPRVQRTVHQLLLESRLSEESLAEKLHLHRRTLNRMLAREGTSFRELAREARFNVAKQRLKDSSATIEQIALTLGFTSSSSFGRAFQQWAGTSPTVFRQQHGT